MTIFQCLFHQIVAAPLAALDSSGLFFPSMDVDAAIVILRRHSELVWLLPFLATAGSLIAAAMAFWIGRKIGKNGLEHWISPGVLESVKREVRHKGGRCARCSARSPAPTFPASAVCPGLRSAVGERAAFLHHVRRPTAGAVQRSHRSRLVLRLADPGDVSDRNF